MDRGAEGNFPFHFLFVFLSLLLLHTSIRIKSNQYPRGLAFGIPGLILVSLSCCFMAFSSSLYLKSNKTVQFSILPINLKRERERDQLNIKRLRSELACLVTVSILSSPHMYTYLLMISPLFVSSTSPPVIIWSRMSPAFC